MFDPGLSSSNKNPISVDDKSKKILLLLLW